MLLISWAVNAYVHLTFHFETDPSLISVQGQRKLSCFTQTNISRYQFLPQLLWNYLIDANNIANTYCRNECQCASGLWFDLDPTSVQGQTPHILHFEGIQQIYLVFSLMHSVTIYSNHWNITSAMEMESVHQQSTCPSIHASITHSGGTCSILVPLKLLWGWI